MNINKRFIVDENGNPTEVIILFTDYQKIEEMLGLDLDKKAVKDLEEARMDRTTGNKKAYKNLRSI